MAVTKPEETPKIIALSLALVCAIAFISVTLLRANNEGEDEDPKRERSANLLLTIPEQSASAGAMVLWQSRIEGVSNPFRAVLSEIPGARPPASITGAGPLDPFSVMSEPPPPTCVLKGVIVGDSPWGDVAVFIVGSETRMIRVGEKLIGDVHVKDVRPEGATLARKGEQQFVGLSGAYTPSAG